MATFKIQIPKPCNESWDKMTPNENGRFCDNCAKSVVDFTAMLPDEIQHYFTENKNQRICGRFKNTQLDSVIIQIPNTALFSQTQYHKMFLLALFISMGTTLFSCSDKNGNKQKIDKVEVVDSSKIEERVTVGEAPYNPNDNIHHMVPPPPPPPNVDHIKFVKPPLISCGETTPSKTNQSTFVLGKIVKRKDTLIERHTTGDVEPRIFIDSTKNK